MIDPSVRPYRAMAFNNAWANHRLLAACARLDQAAFQAPRTGFFPSLHATLNHVLVIDRFYVDAIEGGRLGPDAWRDETPCATVAALQAAQAEVDRRLLRVACALTPDALSRVVTVNRGDHDQHERLDRLLLHLYQHQVHHRGQAHAMLAGTNVAPPQLDEFFAAGEADLRAADVAALGFDEAAIWGDPTPAAD